MKRHSHHDSEDTSGLEALVAQTIVQDARPFLDENQRALEDPMLEIGLYALVPKPGQENMPPPPAHPDPGKFDPLFYTAFKDAANVTSVLKNHLQADIDIPVFEDIPLMGKEERGALLTHDERVHIAEGLDKLALFFDNNPALVEEKQTLSDNEIDDTFRLFSQKADNHSELGLFKAYADFHARKLAKDADKFSATEVITEEKASYMTESVINNFASELASDGIGTKNDLIEAGTQISSALKSVDSIPKTREDTMALLKEERAKPSPDNALQNLPESAVLNPYFGMIAHDLIGNLTEINQENGPAIFDAQQKKEAAQTTEKTLQRLSLKIDSILYGKSGPDISRLPRMER